MARLIHTTRERFRVTESQYLIIGDDDEGPEDDTNVPTGIIVAGPDAAVVYTGTTMGDIWLCLELWDARPPLELSGWDDAGEVTYTATMPARPCTLGDDPPETFPDLAHAGPGTYRIRMAVRGRDEGHRTDVVESHDEPPEEHLIQVWPAPAEPDVLHKATDHIGAVWRPSS